MAISCWISDISSSESSRSVNGVISHQTTTREKRKQRGIGPLPICLTATICLVSLWMALYTVPKLPVPSFSKSVYWLAGLLLGIGYGSDGRSFFSGLGVSGDERTSVGFCWEPEDLLEIRDRFKRVGEGMIKVGGKTSSGKASSSLLGTEAPLHVCLCLV